MATQTLIIHILCFSPCLPGRSYLTFCGFKLKNTSGSGTIWSPHLLMLLSLLLVIVVMSCLRNMCPYLNSVQFTGITVAGETGSGRTRLHFIIYYCCLYRKVWVLPSIDGWRECMRYATYEGKTKLILWIINVTKQHVCTAPVAPTHTHTHTYINVLHIRGFTDFTPIFLVSTEVEFASSQQYLVFQYF